MNKNGFLLLWSMVLISMVGMAVAINISSKDGTLGIYNKLKYSELGYHHALTIEEWGRRYIKGYENNISGWWQNKHRLEKSFQNNMSGLGISGVVAVEDGKMNLFNLIVGSKADKAAYADIFARLYGSDSSQKIKEIIKLMLARKPVIGSSILGEHEHIFTDRVIDDDIMQDPSDVNEAIYKIDFNALDVTVGKLLFDLDESEVANIKAMGVYHGIESVMMAVQVPTKYKSLFKLKVCFII